jgi:hypothetical protein
VQFFSSSNSITTTTITKIIIINNSMVWKKVRLGMAVYAGSSVRSSRLQAKAKLKQPMLDKQDLV